MMWTSTRRGHRASRQRQMLFVLAYLWWYHGGFLASFYSHQWPKEGRGIHGRYGGPTLQRSHWFRLLEWGICDGTLGRKAQGRELSMIMYVKITKLLHSMGGIERTGEVTFKFAFKHETYAERFCDECTAGSGIDSHDVHAKIKGD